jgi:putative heme-binding domain-containing protein
VLFANQTAASRTDVLDRYQTVSTLTGVTENGSAVFDKNCAQCHAYRGHGHAVGPNLMEFAGKSVQDFLVAILDPNAAINPNFLAYSIETKDGRGLTGIVRGETASGLTLVAGGGVEEKILRGDIKEIRASQLSLMPEGLEQGMTPQDVADLIAWLKKSAPAPFGTASANAGQAEKARAEFLRTGANGVAEVLTAAERLPYRSWIGTLPMAYCRQSAGVNKLVWRMNPLSPALSPNGAEGARNGARGSDLAALSSSRNGGEAVGKAGEEQRVTFRLPAAMGFSSQPEGRFALQLNGKPALEFGVALTDQTWQRADGKIRMAYTVMENNSEDSNGVLLIEVSASLLEPGKPATFEVTGSTSDSQRWFGVYLLGP